MIDAFDLYFAVRCEFIDLPNARICTRDVDRGLKVWVTERFYGERWVCDVRMTVADYMLATGRPADARGVARYLRRRYDRQLREQRPPGDWWEPSPEPAWATL